MPRFPSPGSSRVEFPGFIGTIKALRLPAALSAAFRFLHLAVPREHAYFAPAAAAWGGVGPGVHHPVSPSGNSSWKRQDLASSWGTPIPVCTWSQTPAGRYVPNRLRNACVAPAEGNDEGADDNNNFRGSIAWLSGSPPTYHDVGYPSPRKTGFQVLVKLFWTGFHPQGSDKRFQLTSCGCSSSSKLLGTTCPASFCQNPFVFMLRIRLPVAPRLPDGTNAMGRTGWRGRPAGQRPRASQLSSARAAFAGKQRQAPAVPSPGG